MNHNRSCSKEAGQRLSGSLRLIVCASKASCLFFFLSNSKSVRCSGVSAESRSEISLIFVRPFKLTLQFPPPPQGLVEASSLPITVLPQRIQMLKAFDDRAGINSEVNQTGDLVNAHALQLLYDTGALFQIAEQGVGVEEPLEGHRRKRVFILVGDVFYIKTQVLAAQILALSDEGANVA